MKIRALSSFSHPQEDARAEGRDTKRWWIPMDSHRRATQTRLLRLAHAVKCRRQRSPCRRQQLRREALPPCALLHRVQALGSENLNRLKLVLVSAGCKMPCISTNCTESYLPWRFWREGWIANKTLQKLAVQVLESELVLTYLCKAVSQ